MQLNAHNNSQNSDFDIFINHSLVRSFIRRDSHSLQTLLNIFWPGSKSPISVPVTLMFERVQCSLLHCYRQDFKRPLGSLVLCFYSWLPKGLDHVIIPYISLIIHLELQ